MNLELVLSSASVIVAIVAMILTSLLLSRQVRQMEHERNALAVLEAMERLSDASVVEIFTRLRGVNARYLSDADIIERYPNSQDERDLTGVASLIETVAVLCRRRVLDPSLIVDAYGFAIRRHWLEVAPFIDRYRRVIGNPDVLNNFEWLAMYSAWWKDVPRPANDPNYSPQQFAGVGITP